MVQAQMIEQEQTVLQLPRDFLKTPTTLYCPGTWAFALPDRAIQLFQEQERGIAKHSLPLAAFIALLHRYTQQETIDLGLSLSNFQEITDPQEIRVLATGATTGRALIHQLATSLKEFQPDQAAVRLNPGSDPPLQRRSSFPAVVTLLESADPDHDPALTTPSKIAQLNDSADLHLILVQQGQRSSGILNYNASLFQPDTIQRLAGHLQTLLTDMAVDLDCPIAQLPLLTQAEIEQLAAWSSATVDYPAIPMHRQIEAHAVQQPNAIALTFRDQDLTYAELNRRANQLAHYLISLGVGAGVAVAVCVEPCLEILIGLLAIFKAGGVYVPLDPSYPAERLGTILEETQPQVFLTQSHLRPNLPALPDSIGDRIFCCDRDGNRLDASPTHNPVPAVDLDRTAYLVYTSGTTGKPKGVMVSHRNLINYLRVAQERFGINQQDVMPAIARFTFSITMFELLLPLIAGGRLVILEREHILDFQRMVQTLQQVTVVHTSPSLMKKLLGYIQEHDLDGRFQNLRHASCGGDLVPADLLETMKAVFPAAEIFVVYGCSEISCMGCAYPVPRDRRITGNRVGQPFSNVSVRLYDPDRNPVPIGVTGEIWFGGAGVTRGYLHREDLTQEKFVEFGGDRFYRTGDLGRFDQDGNLEILGRNDFQIQLRGMRIEPGEIEATLRQAIGVREAIVMGQSLENGELALVAYVVLDQAQPPGIAQLRQFLQAKLPDYMVPAIFMPLEAMPLTPNGKLDRRSLPAPTHMGADTTDCVNPRTPLEIQIAAIWSQVLGLESVSVKDDFFALGGHSLLATQVIYRLREALSLAIPISQLFESPTVAALAAHLAPLCEAHPGQKNSDFAAIVPTRRQNHSPLSTAQVGLWFLSQLEEGRALNIPLGFTLRGTLHLEALEDSLTEIVRRHETLRTVFPIVNGVVVQRILPPSPLHLSVATLQTLSEPEQSAEVERLAQAAAQYPFDLTVDCPLHVNLLRLDKEAHVLLVTLHHIAADGWSLAVFRRELAALYAAFSQGQPSPLAELPLQYADFVQWQQQWLQSEWLDRQLTYWQQQLAGASPILELPTDRPRPSIQTFNGGAAFFTLDADLTDSLKTLSQRTSTTLFMTLLAALATLLSRYGGQQDIVIGSPIANRPRSETEPLIGFFINLLALRVDLTGNPDFLELLQRVRRVALDAYANQDIPFGQVVETVQPNRNRGHSPLFQVMFILQNSPDQEFNLPGLTLSPLHTESGTAQYDLRLMMSETAGSLSGELEYNRDLFDADTMTRLMGHFKTLLQAIVTDPARSIATLPLMSASERQQTLGLGHGPHHSYPQNCVHQLIELQAMRTPDAIALMTETEQLTYRELNQRANQLAHYLQILGVGPEVLVAIVLERSIDLLVSILAVLKAGGAYVPIDPAYPSERQTYQLSDSQTPVILTQQSLAAALPISTAQVIAVDGAWKSIAQASAENLSPQATPQNLAYIIYTSGSTGNPKGVMVTHQGVVNHSTASVAAFELTPADRVLQFSSMGFDIFVEEVFPTLISGATLMLRSDEMILSIRAFCKFVQRYQITVLDIPTAFWHELVNGLSLAQKNLPACVRLLVVGGEKASRAAYQQWLRVTGYQVRWLNTYGPTEATVTTTLYDPTLAGFDATSAEIPIGRAIANLQTYILDAGLQPVPIGVPGELHIGGVGLARGYLNLPEKSQEKFIPHPFEADPTARLYKTGDIAYYLPDGNIGFVGRSDYQVKIRGFRIELGEIETCLEQHPAVQQAVVLVRQDDSGNKSLVGYVVTPDPQALTRSELHQFLQPKLPPYMVPAVWVVLQNFPLTANGKVDRQALPLPDPEQRQTDAPFAAPQSELESQLIQIWESVLKTGSIGVNDNFFDLGGHSLLAVRLWAQIEQVTHQELPLSTLFQAPTIQQLAARLGRSQADPAPRCPSLVVLQPGAITDTPTPLFCIHILGRGMKFYRPMLQYLDPQQPVYGLSTNMTGELLPSDRVEDLAAHYLRQMQTTQPQGPYLLVGISFGGMVAFEIAQQLLDQGEEVGFLGLLDTYTANAVRQIALASRMQEHRRSLVNLGPRYLWEKIWEKGVGQVRSWTDLLTEVYHRLMIKLLNAMKRPLPEDLQDFTYQKQSYRLAGNYKLRPYPGQATLFKASKEQIGGVSFKIDPAMGWDQVVQGELKIHIVPGTHLDMLQEPQVQVLAEKLQASLTQFHTSNRVRP